MLPCNKSKNVPLITFCVYLMIVYSSCWWYLIQITGSAEDLSWIYYLPYSIMPVLFLHLSSNCSPLYPASFIPQHLSLLLRCTAPCSSTLLHSFSSSCFPPLPKTQITRLLFLPAREKVRTGRRPALTWSVACFGKLLASVNNSGLCRDEKDLQCCLKMRFFPVCLPALGHGRINYRE